MLDNIGLVQMNGLVMDTVLGRFVLADKKAMVRLIHKVGTRYV
jgi:hypothetical protein